jgi:hypothetical protein
VPSAALTRWKNDRTSRLGYTDAHCIVLFAPPATALQVVGPPLAPPLLAQESLQGYVMLVSGHFQGFCRDLYTECSQICAAAVPAGLRPTVQAQFAAELRLNTGNPTAENIRKDFERFGFLLNFAIAHPANPLRLTHLGHLNYWRNAVAHQKATPPPPGVPTILNLADVQVWRGSCDGLATSLDDRMYSELFRIRGVAPW